ncbi:hypothetical protein TNCV_4017751 [Trichonephila clavipes]|nr:hypothetical protein TNCV_4017751 [Trichonephila clavipes]
MVDDDYREEIIDFVQLIPAFRACDEEDVETWMACDVEELQALTNVYLFPLKWCLSGGQNPRHIEPKPSIITTRQKLSLLSGCCNWLRRYRYTIDKSVIIQIIGVFG